MKLQAIILLTTVQKGLFRGVCAFLALVLGCCLPAFAAKPASLMAIEVFDAPTGAAYLEVVDALINAKPELRDCSSFQGTSVDKSAYGKMQKVALSAGGILERDQTGVLRYSATEGHKVCVVPDNVKFEHNAAFSLSDLADQAKLTGTPVPGAVSSIPPIQKGVKIAFVATQDRELAEYLLAQRSASIAGWKNYLSKYPSSRHSDEAKQNIVQLYSGAGESSLLAYQKSSSMISPSYKDLKEALMQANLALAVLPSQERALKLLANVRKELTAITSQERDELQAYNAALQSHKAGYVHLQNAKKLSDALSGIDPGFQAGEPLLADVLKASNSIDAALRSAEAAVAAKQMDKAVESITPLIPFSSEEPRIPAIVDAAYNYYLQLGKQLSDTGDWEKAIEQINKAQKLKDTKDVHDALVSAHNQLTIAQDKAAADKALATSKEFEDQHDTINAFETLYFLPPPQKALVADDLERLKPSYVQAAVKAAKDLKLAHEALSGIADEIGIEKALTYLKLIYKLTNEESYQDTINVLAEDLSNYFLARAQLYLDKPSGSGTELGMVYIDEALLYLPSNQKAHDAKTDAAAAHAMHSKLSLGVQFHDQTSSRLASGFISELEDTIITGLDAPTVKAVRLSEVTGKVQPDYLVAGDVLEHEIYAPPTVTSKQSNYLAGTHEEPNEKWNKANRAVETAKQNLQPDQNALLLAQAKGNKKASKDLGAKVTQDQKAISDAQAEVDSLARTVTSDVIRSYNYKQTTFDVRNTIKLQFRIGETLSGEMGDPVIVKKEDPRQFVLIEDVKPEDTNGVRPSGTMPDIKELQTTLENAVREELITDVKAKVNGLPKLLYVEAQSKEQGENIDGAGEFYLRFLSCTAEDGSAERKHAKDFLLKNFNMSLEESVTP